MLSLHTIKRYPVIDGLSVAMVGSVPPGVQSVLTIAAAPGLVPDNVRHRHTPLLNIDEEPYFESADWVARQVRQSRTVMIRSEGGRQRAGAVAAIALVYLGGTAQDALSCLSWKLDPPLDALVHKA